MRRFIFLFSFCSLMAGLTLLLSCEGPAPKGARAFEITDRRTLIGGPMALGNLGDFMMENGKIRTVISKPGISEAFGLFGGNIMDADRVRSGASQGNSLGAGGFDTLVETFPLFFLSTVDPQRLEILQDGRDGKAAKIRVRGIGASFIALTEQINNLVSFMGGKNRLNFIIDYTLAPGKNYIQLDITMENPQNGYNFQSFGAIPAVTGMIGLFGKRNTVFIPGMAAYNIRFSLEQVFTNKLQPPAIPGLVGDFVASRGRGRVNYGFVAAKAKDNYVISNQKEFKKLGVPISESSIHVPLEGSSITACFTRNVNVKALVKKGGRFTYTVYLVIGDGSVSSIRDAQLEIHQKAKGLVSGRVFQEQTYAPQTGSRVMAFRYTDPTKKGNTPGSRIFYSDFVVNAQGNFKGYLEPGKYLLVARDGLMKSKEYEVTVEKDKKSYVELQLPRPAILAFTLRDQEGRMIPGKVSVLGRIADFENGRCIGQSSFYCLFDPHLDQPTLVSDFRGGRSCEANKGEKKGKSCAADVDCKGIGDGICRYRLQADTEYREAFKISPTGSGIVEVRGLPAGKKYKIVASRGIEYEITSQEVVLRPGQVTQIELVLKHSVPTPKMLSSDFHVHTNLSHDSSIPDSERVTSFAAEGVDHFVTTDHNRIRSLKPMVEALRLERWVNATIGVELTTFEMGHFNAFPLKLDLKKFNGGTPQWFKKDTRYNKDVQDPRSGSDRPLKGLRQGLPPTELFALLRKQGSLCKDDPNCPQTIVQVNHPRDAIFGYFNTYNLSPDNGYPTYLGGLTTPLSREFEYTQYNDRFEALEIFNGKRTDLIWNWRLPPTSLLSGYIQKFMRGYKLTPGLTLRTVDESTGIASIAYPGGGSDWFNLLNRGKKYAQTGNSDTHGLGMEAGMPRNYLLTGFSDPQKLTDQILTKTVLEKKLFSTSGPIIDFTVEAPDGSTKPMGSTVKAHTKNGKKVAIFRLRIRAASWVDVSAVTIYKNGRIVQQIQLKPTQEVLRYDEKLELDVSDGDAWFVVTVLGKKDMWPVYVPEEVEPFQIGQAVSLVQDTLLGSLPIQLGASESVCLQPAQARQIKPYAISNPIWIDTNGDGFKADPCRTLGPLGVRCNKAGTICQQGRCVDPTDSCRSDKDCTEKSEICMNGKCTVSACSGLTCAPKFRTCTDRDTCPDDTCAPNKRTCKDGSSCRKDSDCKGVGDGRCRYCGCPTPRKACEDGKACDNDQDCDGKKCSTRRFCYPTGCAQGHCLPVYPMCTNDKLAKVEHHYLRAKSSTQRTQKNQRLAQKHSEPVRSLSTHGVHLRDHHDLCCLKQAMPGKTKLELENIKKFLLFFEHRH